VQIARVVGDVVATMKSEALTGHKLLVLQPVTPDRAPIGRAVVAADAVGAGVGEYVFYVRGREASFPFLPAETPVDACVIGIVDHWDMEGAPPAAHEARPARSTRRA
jgi:microcompartment protein CcmK/EutM